MACCEKCWRDAYLRAYIIGFVCTQAECYRQLRADHHCTEEEQRGTKAIDEASGPGICC
jgi:hypothetical protein